MAGPLLGPAEHLVANGEGAHAVAEGLHHAGKIGSLTRGERRREATIKTAFADRDLAGIDPGCLDRHQHFCPDPRRVVDLAHLKHIDPAVFVESHRLHAVSLLSVFEDRELTPSGVAWMASMASSEPIGVSPVTAAAGSASADRRWAILALLGVAQLMVVLDSTIVNIALPSAQRSLGFSTDSRQWVVTAYALAFGSLLLLGGKLGDLFGRKWTFIAGLIGFAAASGIGGLAQSFGMLVVARALQGAFGALLAPSALSLLTVTFAGSPDRAKAFGIFGAIAGGGASVGLILGGVLTQTLSWRWCLYVNVLIALPTVLVALRLLQNHPPEGRPRIDVPGVLLACGGLFALVYGFSNAETHSWTTPLTIVSLAASVVLLAAFVAVEAAGRIPFFPSTS